MKTDFLLKIKFGQQSSGQNNESLTWVWQNWGRSTKFNFSNSIEYLLKIQAEVFQMHQLRQATKR